MKQRPCFLSMSFLPLTFLTTTQSTDLWFCLQKVPVILCPSRVSSELKVSEGGLGGCFLSEVVEELLTLNYTFPGLQLLF